MAAATCHMTMLRVVQSHRVTLEKQAVRSSCGVGATLGGSWCGGAGARLRASRVERWWGCRSSGSAKLAVSAVVDAGVSASEAESGSDVAAESLSMYFKAEGSLNENAISKVTKALEGSEGVSQVKVYVDEGAATVELVKQTNIQATGVASSLVEIIEQAGFKMQALSLGFDDDDAEDDEYIDYDASTYNEGEEATTE